HNSLNAAFASGESPRASSTRVHCVVTNVSGPSENCLERFDWLTDQSASFSWCPAPLRSSRQVQYQRRNLLLHIRCLIPCFADHQIERWHQDGHDRNEVTGC